MGHTLQIITRVERIGTDILMLIVVTSSSAGSLWYNKFQYMFYHVFPSLDRQGEALQPSTEDMPFPCSAERAFGEPSHKQTVEHPP